MASYMTNGNIQKFRLDLCVAVFFLIHLKTSDQASCANVLLTLEEKSLLVGIPTDACFVELNGTEVTPTSTATERFVNAGMLLSEPRVANGSTVYEVNYKMTGTCNVACDILCSNFTFPLDIPSVWNGTVTDFTGSVEDNLPIIVATVICNLGAFI